MRSKHTVEMILEMVPDSLLVDVVIVLILDWQAELADNR